MICPAAHPARGKATLGLRTSTLKLSRVGEQTSIMEPRVPYCPQPAIHLPRRPSPQPTQTPFSNSFPVILASKRHSQGTRAQPSNSSALGKGSGSPRILLNSHEQVPSPAGRAEEKTELCQVLTRQRTKGKLGPGLSQACAGALWSLERSEEWFSGEGGR